MKEEFEEKELNALSRAKATSTDSFSLLAQYGIVDIALLLELVMKIRLGCKYDGGNLYAVGTQMEGHAVGLSLQCSTCGDTDIWWSSFQYGDNSFQINRDIVRAWFCTGGESGKYEDFATELRAGVYSRTRFDLTVKLIIPIIFQMEDRTYFENLTAVNLELKEGVIFGFDVQHSRPQRSFGPATLASGTFICHNRGHLYGKLLLQTHMSKRQMKEEEKTGSESKDKLVTDRGLQKLSLLCNNIQRGICDGAGSGQKTFRELIIQNAKHSTATLSLCSWHKCKNLSKDFKAKLFDKSRS